MKDKRVVFTTNNSNFSRGSFAATLLRRGLNVCEKPEDALYFLEQEVDRLNQRIGKCQSEGADKEDAVRKRQQAQDRIQYFKEQCRGCPTTSSSPKESTLRNVITTAYTCAWYVKHCKIERPFVLCSGPGLLTELKAHGIDYVSTLDEETGDMKEAYGKEVTIQNVTELLTDIGDVDAIIVGWDLKITAIKIAVAASLLQLSRANKRQIRLITCSFDKSGVL